MSNKRILVRLINHTTGYDQHQMIDVQDCPIAIRGQVEANYRALVTSAGCAMIHDLGRLVSGAKAYGAAQHSTLLVDGWLVQLRIDISKAALAANDNDSEIKERHA